MPGWGESRFGPELAHVGTSEAGRRVATRRRNTRAGVADRTRLPRRNSTEIRGVQRKTLGYCIESFDTIHGCHPNRSPPSTSSTRLALAALAKYGE
jgi:hypothetical protein